MNSLKPDDKVIIYSGAHYGRVHRIIEIIGRTVNALQVDTRDWVGGIPFCDCELVQTQEVA